MRILMVPIVSYPSNLEADSQYLILRSFLERASRWYPDVAWHVAFPYYDPLVYDQLGSMDRVYVWHVLEDRKHFAPAYVYEMSTSTARAIARKHGWLTGETPVDAIVWGSPLMLETYNAVRMPKYSQHPRYVLWDLLFKPFEGRNEGGRKLDLGARAALGFQAADLMIAESPWSEHLQTSSMARVFSREVAAQALGKTKLIPLGFDAGRVDRHRRPRTERPSVYIGSRFTQSKRNELALEALLKVAALRDFDVLISSGEPDIRRGRRAIKENDAVKITRCPTMEEALEIMTSCWYGVNLSTFELFCSSLFEQLYAGLGVLLADEPWQRGLVPEGYPRVPDNVDGLAGAFLKALDGELAFPDVRDEVRRRYDYDATMRMVCEAVLDGLRSVYEVMFPHRVMLTKMPRERGAFTIAKLRSMLPKQYLKLRSLQDYQTFSQSGGVGAAAVKHGWVDDIHSPITIFKKGDEA